MSDPQVGIQGQEMQVTDDKGPTFGKGVVAAPSVRLVDPAKVHFLFGPASVAGLDPDDPDDRARLIEETSDTSGSPAEVAIREVLANQIADEDPPEVWAAARRLMGLGLDRDAVWVQMVMALAAAMSKARTRDGVADPSVYAGVEDPGAEYAGVLAALPLPTITEIEAALLAEVREHPGVRARDADLAVLATLGRSDEGDKVVRHLLGWVSERLADVAGPLAWLCDDRTVHVGDLTDGIVLTHRLSAHERGVGAIVASFDLAGFSRRDHLRLADGAELTPVSAGSGQVVWLGPDGWLDAYQDDSLLSLRVTPDGLVSLETLAGTPELDPALVGRLRAVYDAEFEEPGLPVRAEILVLGLLLADRSTFAVPHAPLAELCAAAGLEQRGHEVAHDEEGWAKARRVRRLGHVMRSLGERGDRDAAVAALRAADEDEGDPARLRAVLRGLADPDVLDVVADELLGLDDDPVALEETRRFSERLLGAAKRPPEIAVARWLTAVVAERSGDAQAAEGHLHLAVDADPTWLPALDRLAWYASDRGDAPSAVRLWRRLGVDRSANPDLQIVEPLSRSAMTKPGRNEPCWCGSGRKYKQCHIGRVKPVALPERVGWLYRKAAAYVERRGGMPGVDVMDLARARSVDRDDIERVTEALEDPFVVDVALLEGGWFERFLSDRGPLLPDDEALLAAAWTLVPRTIYEIVAIRPGVGMTVHDLGTGDDLDVRERSLSRQAKPGQVVCGRAVPDGEAYQFVGAVFPVLPGTETEVLRLCDEGLGFDLCDYVARRDRPPSLRTREGEPLVVCEASMDLPDIAPARRALDDRYEREGEDGWVEMHELGEDDRILRAQLQLDGARLMVTTHSEPRMDRVLDALRADIPGLVLVRDTRKPLRAGEFPPAPPGLAGPPPGLDNPEMIEQIQDVQERRWLREHVPALGGLTPVEAASDPSRVEQLERLLASFPVHSPDGGLVVMRPQRIRALLGLREDGPT